MANFYQHTKFEANIFIDDRDIAEDPKSNMATAAILNFGKSGILGYSDTYRVGPKNRTVFRSL